MEHGFPVLMPIYARIERTPEPPPEPEPAPSVTDPPAWWGELPPWVREVIAATLTAYGIDTTTWPLT